MNIKNFALPGLLLLSLFGSTLNAQTYTAANYTTVKVYNKTKDPISVTKQTHKGEPYEQIESFNIPQGESFDVVSQSTSPITISVPTGYGIWGKGGASENWGQSKEIPAGSKWEVWVDYK